MVKLSEKNMTLEDRELQETEFFAGLIQMCDESLAFLAEMACDQWNTRLAAAVWHFCHTAIIRDNSDRQEAIRILTREGFRLCGGMKHIKIALRDKEVRVLYESISWIH